MSDIQDIYENYKTKTNAKRKASDMMSVILEIMLIIDLLSFVSMLLVFPVGAVLFILCMIITGMILIYDGKYCGDMPPVSLPDISPAHNVAIANKNMCPDCNGTGRCNYCYGTGHFGKSSVYGHSHNWPCTPCNSTGACRRCEGTGYR